MSQALRTFEADKDLLPSLSLALIKDLEDAAVVYSALVPAGQTTCQLEKLSLLVHGHLIVDFKLMHGC